ncbi:hypothetical protein H6P81_005390 [Aristolochia fimbriata]|uniref:Uncharacterized protein n=1 Tax=Aristolochia fimbriata TaxID=158543 RepID=A0AAV7EX54_ARIFI|nr:hypothetical protein H6P81_005390 [Aristolochia fimbriata]
MSVRSCRAFHSWRERVAGGDVSHAGEPSHVVEPARDELHDGVVQGVGLRLDGDCVSRTRRGSNPTKAYGAFDLPPERHPPTPEPALPLSSLLSAARGARAHRHPPIRKIYNERRRKKAIGAREPSSAL